MAHVKKPTLNMHFHLYTGKSKSPVTSKYTIAILDGYWLLVKRGHFFSMFHRLRLPEYSDTKWENVVFSGLRFKSIAK
jgi:hypothetical protein